MSPLQVYPCKVRFNFLIPTRKILLIKGSFSVIWNRVEPVTDFFKEGQKVHSYKEKRSAEFLKNEWGTIIILSM